MRQPGQKAVPFFVLRGGVWRATLPIQVSTQQAGPHAPDFPEMLNDRMRKQAW
jgi:hypothetical protein